MFRFRRALPLILALLLLPLSLQACTPPPPPDDFAYAEGAFSASVRGTYPPAGDGEGAPRSFAAQITAGAPVAGDPTLRNLSVTFTAPEALAGVTVTATLSPASEGTVTRTVTFTYPSDYGKVQATAESGALGGLLRFAEALLPIGDVTEISPTAPDGSFSVTRQRGARVATFSFAGEGTHPLGVTLSDGRGTVTLTVK